MLDDFERKLLRVLFNFFARHRRMPSWRELSAMTYRSADELVHTLTALENRQYIYWDNKNDPSTIIMIQSWERREKRPRTTSQATDSSYWTQY
ncbi:hypothetical protein [Paenibacillus sp. Z6-24]